MNLSVPRFGVVDLCIVVAIAFCSYQLVKTCCRDVVWVPDYVRGNDDGTDATLTKNEDVVHETRVCAYDGTTATEVVVELTYSGLRPINNSADVDVIGDNILYNLFEVKPLRHVCNSGARALPCYVGCYYYKPHSVVHAVRRLMPASSGH